MWVCPRCAAGGVEVVGHGQPAQSRGVSAAVVRVYIGQAEAGVGECAQCRPPRGSAGSTYPAVSGTRT